MYRVTTTRRFDQCVERLIKQGRDIRPMLHVINLLKTGEKLPAKYNDHQLKGRLKAFRECHIKADWLLMYYKDAGRLVLVLERTGTHRDVLNIE